MVGYYLVEYFIGSTSYTQEKQRDRNYASHKYILRALILHSPFSAILRVIAKKLEGDAVSTMDQEELTSTVFRYLSNFHATIVDLGTATVLVQTLVAITALPQHEDFTDSLSKLDERFF